MRYFFSRQGIPEIHTPDSSPYSLESTQAFRNKTIPFSHIYIAPDAYFDKILNSVSADERQCIQELSSAGQQSIQKHQRFPQELNSLDIETVSIFHNIIGEKSHIHIVITNGFGRTQKAHKEGILNLQRLARLLAPISVQFHVMQDCDQKLAPIYAGLENIFIYPGCMSVNRFFNADFYIDVSLNTKKTSNSQLLPLTQKFPKPAKKTPKKIPKIAVVIPHYGPQGKLNDCLDALINVEGFDPRWLYIVDNNANNRYFTLGVNHGLEQALEDDCDYFWVLNNDTQPDTQYLQATLERFNSNSKVGIVGGKNLVTDRPDRIFWGGSHQAFPTGIHKAGYVSKGSLNEASQESWATFSSVVIRRETLNDCGLLDSEMRMIFSDSDYCFQAGLKGWQVWYEPKAIILHDTGVSRNTPNQTIIDIFRKDKRAFYWKWVKITGCDDPEKLQAAIFTAIDFEGSEA